MLIKLRSENFPRYNFVLLSRLCLIAGPQFDVNRSIRIHCGRWICNQPRRKLTIWPYVLQQDGCRLSLAAADTV